MVASDYGGGFCYNLEEEEDKEEIKQEVRNEAPVPSKRNND
jgi:hypothetical protein